MIQSSQSFTFISSIYIIFVLKDEKLVVVKLMILLLSIIVFRNLNLLDLDPYNDLFYQEIYILF